MKKNISLLGALIMSVSGSSLVANITFGSDNAGITVVGGTSLVFDFPVTTTLDGGLLRDHVGNKITATQGLACTNMTFDVVSEDSVEPYTLKVNGTVVPGDAITLGDDQKLSVVGGRILEEVVINGASNHQSIIEGYGEFDNTLSMTSNSEVIMRWNGQLNQNIVMNATNAVDGLTPADTCYMRLCQDLEFAPGYFCILNGNGNCFIDCFNNANQYKLIIGGTSSADLVLDYDFHILNPYVRLSGPILINNTKSLYIHGGYVDGANQALKFQTIYSFLNNNDMPITLHNVVFEGVTPNTFIGEGDWTFVNCRLTSDASSWYVTEGLTLDLLATSFDMTAKLTNDNPSLCVGFARFASASNNELTISLNTDLALYDRWRFDEVPTIKGNGNTITLHTIESEIDGVPELFFQGVFQIGASGLRFENVTLANMKGVSVDTSIDGNVLQLLDVNWMHHDGNQIFITGLNEDAAELHLVADSEDIAGNIFSTDVTWANKARIELLGDTSLSSTWTFQEDTIIDGRGAVFNFEDAVFKIAPSATLTLRNIVLRNVTQGLFEHTIGNTGAVRLSNVILELDESVTWTKDIFVNGPVTVITGAHTLTGLNVEVGTVLYDTLGTPDIANVSVWAGRVLRIGSGSGGSEYDPEITGTITINGGDTELDKNEYLFPDAEAINGRFIHCISSGRLIGNARTIVFPQTHGIGEGAAVVLTVDAEQVLTVTDAVFDRLVPAEHLDISGVVCFGHNTVVRFNQDVTLNTQLRFGSNDSEITDTYSEIDLGGHCLDLGELGSLMLVGAENADNTLVIKNGQIIVRSTDQLPVDNTGNELVFENVEIILFSDWVHSVGALTFKGKNRISGASGGTLRTTSVNDTRILEGSFLTLTDGIVYSHASTGQFIFDHATSCLELIGGTFRHPDYADEESAANLTLSTGTLISDHKSYIQPGLGGITIADSLTIELRPGATIIVNEARFESSEDTSAGTLTYGASEGGA